MKPIKFKGYNKKNQKWLYGSYIHNVKGDFIAPDGIFSDEFTWEDFLVEPESVKQLLCTLSDGTELYDGDRVVDKQGLKYTLSFAPIVVDGLEYNNFNPKKYKPIKN